MADENKIVTPSDIEEAKTETVDTQTTATVENTVAEKDEKVESVVTDEEIASVEITQPQKAQSSSLRAQMKSLRDEEEEEAKEKEEEKSQPEEEPVRGDSIIEEKLAKIEKEEKMSKAEARAEKAALKAAEKAAKEEAKAVNKKETKQKKVQPKEKGKKKMQTYQHRQNKYGYAFMAPWIVGFLLFTLFPFVATIFLSFMNVKKAATGYVLKFAGINNYITAFIKNSDFLPALLSYLKMIIPYTFIVVVLSFIIAYLLNKI